MRDYPVGRPLRVLQGFLVTAYRIEICQRGDHPSVLAGIEVFVYPGDSELSACRIVELEVLSAVLSFDQICVLTDVERSVRAGEEALDVALNILRYIEIFVVFELRIGECVDPHDLCLDVDQLFKVGLVPVSAGGVLIGPSPHGVLDLLLEA